MTHIPRNGSRANYETLSFRLLHKQLPNKHVTNRQYACLRTHGRISPRTETIYLKSEAVAFIRHLAKARAREEPAVLKRRGEQGWRLRWCGLLACAAARAFAASLMERRVSGGSDGATPSVHEVLNDCRFVGLGLAA